MDYVFYRLRDFVLWVNKNADSPGVGASMLFALFVAFCIGAIYRISFDYFALQIDEVIGLKWVVGMTLLFSILFMALPRAEPFSNQEETIVKKYENEPDTTKRVYRLGIAVVYLIMIYIII